MPQRSSPWSRRSPRATRYAALSGKGAAPWYGNPFLSGQRETVSRELAGGDEKRKHVIKRPVVGNRANIAQTNQPISPAVRPRCARRAPSRRRRDRSLQALSHAGSRVSDAPLSRRRSRSRRAMMRNENASRPKMPGFRGDLDQHVVRLAPCACALGRVVVLELAGADAGERVFEERVDPFLHHRSARLARAGVLRLSASASTIVAMRVQKALGAGTASRRRTRDDDRSCRTPRRILRPSSASAAMRRHEPEHAPARLREDDRRQHQERDDRRPASRFIGRLRALDIATTIAAGRNVTMFSARSFGLPKMPPTGPASRPPSTRFVAAGVVEHAARRDEARCRAG